MKTKDPMLVVAFRIEADDLIKLDELAAKRGVQRSQFIREALQRTTTKEQKQSA